MRHLSEGFAKVDDIGQPKLKLLCLLAKLNWQFHCESNSLWAHVLKQKYANRRRGVENQVIFSKSNYSSPTWRGIKESRLSFWFDKWLSKGALRELISGPLNRGEKLLQLKDVYKLGSWDRNTISFAIPMTLIQDIKVIPMPLGTIGIDQLSWFSAPSRGFDLNEA
nr:hypothetical protein CFP56_74625 [Quercus suber]